MSSWLTAHLCVPSLLALCHRKGTGVAGDTTTADLWATSCFCSWEKTWVVMLLALAVEVGGDSLGVELSLFVCSSLKCNFQWHLAGSAADKIQTYPKDWLSYLRYF